MSSELPVTATATFCATLVDQWVSDGLTAAFIAPGSRSTPLALAFSAPDSGVRCHVFHDERSAAFAALGHGLATGRPAAVLCTSGTAATHFHGAVVEAEASDVPLLVCTADRPPELWGIGAPQTIDQTELYGGAVRWFTEPGPPDDEGVDPDSWRPLARTSWQRALGTSTARPGPVHLNLSFRDPLVGAPGPLPEALAPREAESAAGGSATSGASLTDLPPLAGRTGVIVAGRSSADPSMVWALAEQTGWPVIADHRSGCRRRGAIQRADTLLRHSFLRESWQPEVILRIGEPLASKAVGQWIAARAADTVSPAEVIALTDRGRPIDPERVARHTFAVEDALPALVAAGGPPCPTEWGAIWRAADDAAERTITRVLDEADDVTEPAVARAVLASVPSGGALMVASSMPVRDLEWFGGTRDDIDVFANRGANGIDGVTSTAIGVAATGRSTTLLIGDVAFLHDTNALIGLGARAIDLTIVVVDNRGGGIFSFLPQHELLADEQYELLFGTPHAVDLAALSRAHGLTVEPWVGEPAAPAGVRIVIATTDRGANLALHGQVVDAVHRAVNEPGWPQGRSSSSTGA